MGLDGFKKIHKAWGRHYPGPRLSLTRSNSFLKPGSLFQETTGLNPRKSSKTFFYMGKSRCLGPGCGPAIELGEIREGEVNDFYCRIGPALL